MKLPYPAASETPLLLAPMAGVSEPPFRRISRDLGADVVITEFLSSEAIRRRIGKTLEGCEFDEIERPIGIQIYGADPSAMAEAAELITKHYNPNFIDINFGCPVKKVVQRNGGSGCLRDMHLVSRIIRDVVSATHLPVTVKTRSGWNDESRNPIGIALAMQEAGAKAFTLHARTRTGRPKPAPPTLEERFAVALRHARLALELQGDSKHTMIEFRKHFGWYTRGLPHGGELRQKLFVVDSMSAAEAIFTRYLEERPVPMAGAA